MFINSLFHQSDQSSLRTRNSQSTYLYFNRVLLLYTYFQKFLSHLLSCYLFSFQIFSILLSRHPYKIKATNVFYHNIYRCGGHKTKILPLYVEDLSRRSIFRQLSKRRSKRYPFPFTSDQSCTTIKSHGSHYVRSAI